MKSLRPVFQQAPRGKTFVCYFVSPSIKKIIAISSNGANSTKSIITTNVTYFTTIAVVYAVTIDINIRVVFNVWSIVS